jgi:hypothetical protein
VPPQKPFDLQESAHWWLPLHTPLQHSVPTPHAASFGFFVHPGAASTPVSAAAESFVVLPSTLLVPDVPLVPEVPLVPDVPLVPLVPEVPLLPLLPLSLSSAGFASPMPASEAQPTSSVAPVTTRRATQPIP